MMITMHQVRRFLVALLAVVTAGVVPSSIGNVPTVSAQTVDPGGEYFPILDAEGNPTVSRILDTRKADKDTAPFGAKPLNRSFEVQIAGRGSVPASGVLAVLANVTVTQPSAQGNLSVGPAKSTPWPPKSSLLNFLPNQNMPNSQVLTLSDDGRLGVHLFGVKSGTAHVIIDVAGFIATSDYDGSGGPPVEDGARVVPVEPERILDLRKSNVPPGWPAGTPLGERQSVELPVRSRAKVVPDSPDVVGVVLNLTGVNTYSDSQNTYLAVTPSLVPPSAQNAPVSSTNLRRGLVKANLVFAPLSADGSVFVYNRWGRAAAVVDVVGYVTTGDIGARTGRVLPLGAAFRSFDTRRAEFGNARLPQASWEDWSYSDFAKSVKYEGGGDVGLQSGFIGNLTGVGGSWVPVSSSTPTQTHLAVQPGGAQLPTGLPGESTVNFRRGENVANSALVRYGSNGAGDNQRISVFNRWGRSHYLMDVYAVILTD